MQTHPANDRDRQLKVANCIVKCLSALFAFGATGFAGIRGADCVFTLICDDSTHMNYKIQCFENKQTIILLKGSPVMINLTSIERLKTLLIKLKT